jgi:inorganic pyrophosphatase
MKATKRTSQRQSILLSDLSPYGSDTGTVHVVTETPKGSANKLDYDPELGAFRLRKILPQGMVFPFDFGFLPGTLADDGDPEDVLLLIEAPLVPGVVVPARLIGVIEAVQTEKDGKPEENDRLIAVAAACQLYANVRALSDLPKEVIDQIQHFFVTYNAECGKKFIPKGQRGPKRAAKCLQQSRKRFFQSTRMRGKSVT